MTSAPATGFTVLIGFLGGVLAMLLFIPGIRRRMKLMELSAGRLAQDVERLQAILDHSPAVISLKDRDGRHLLVNRQFEELYQTTREQVLGKTDHDLFPCEMADVIRANDLRVWESRAPLELEETVPQEDGLRVYLSIKFPLCDDAGNPYALCGISTDISERVRSMHRILYLQESLERRNAQVEAANKELEAFSYSVSHDLRAPLRSIDGFSQALLEDCAGQLGETGQGHLQRVRAATQRMGQLIDDLLHLSRVTRSELCRETVDLSALARSIGEVLQQRDPGRRFEMLIVPGLSANADRRLMQVALENLLGNASKFAGKRERPTIEFGQCQSGGEPVYYVRDNGVGFDMAYAEKLFGAFQRLHGTNEFPGTGIGLATVQRIVHRHGGRIWGEGAVDQGATFYFTLEHGVDDDE